MLRVEHYGKGAPAWSTPLHHRQARRVPAVTGAFISAERAWFERLGGLTEDYLFGHYEDADLCLKMPGVQGTAGVAAGHAASGTWRARVRPAGRHTRVDRLVNRWLFTRRWSAFLQDGLLGREPTSPILAEAQGVDRAAPGSAASAPAFGPLPPEPAPPAKPRRFAERLRR